MSATPGMATTSPLSLPTPMDVVRASYDFAGKRVEEQKAFALRLTEIATARIEDGRKTVAQVLDGT